MITLVTTTERSPGSIDQLVAAFLFSLIFLLILSIAQPFKRDDDDYFAKACSAAHALSHIRTIEFVASLQRMCRPVVSFCALDFPLLLTLYKGECSSTPSPTTHPTGRQNLAPEPMVA